MKENGKYTTKLVCAQPTGGHCGQEYNRSGREKDPRVKRKVVLDSGLPIIITIE